MSSPRTIRKKFLVNPSMQLSVAGAVLSAFLALSAVFVGSNLLLEGGEGRLGEPSSQEAMRMGMVVAGAYFLLVLTAVIVVAVVATQKIAGPAMLIEEALRGMLRGDFDRRLELRCKDHLAGLAAAASEVREMLLNERSAAQGFHDELDEALQSGDLERARVLNRERRSPSALPTREAA